MQQTDPVQECFESLQKLAQYTNASKTIFLMVVLLFRNAETNERKREILTTVINWAETMDEKELFSKMRKMEEYPTEEQMSQMEREEKVRFPRR